MTYTTINTEQRKALKRKYRGKKYVRCRIYPTYQGTSDREYQRVAISYMHEANVALKACLTNITKQYGTSPSRFRAKVKSGFNAVKAQIDKRIEERGLDALIGKTGVNARNREVRDWKKTIKQTFDIDIEEGYYKEGQYQQMVEQWATTNISMIKSLIDGMIDKMAETIMEARAKRMPMKDMLKNVQKEYESGRMRARLMARDQMVKLNTQLTKAQQGEAGIDSYIWTTMHDKRVRACHRSFSGKVFKWDNPPESWYRTSTGIVHTGKRYNPGEDYGCRCYALPVFDINKLNLPVKVKK